jgi:formiminotetrahydrofolate cyclodeaminase
MYCNKSLKDYLDDLAARLPAPGGGSAAALTAGLGAALVSMVVNFTLGKPKYAKYEKELRKTLKESERLRKEFLKLTDLDVLAYKSKDIKKSLVVPLRVCRFCYEGIMLCPPLITKGNINLVSDVSVAAALLESAFASAYVNVEINLKYLKNSKVSLKLRKELTAKYNNLKKIRLKTEAGVGKIIRG